MKRVLCSILLLALAIPCVADSVADSLVYMRVPKTVVDEHIKQAKDLEAERVYRLAQSVSKR